MLEKEIIENIEEISKIKYDLEEYYNTYTPDIKKGYSQKKSCLLYEESEKASLLVFSLSYILLSSIVFFIYSLNFTNIMEDSFIISLVVYFVSFHIYFFFLGLFYKSKKVLRFFNSLIIRYDHDYRMKYLQLKKNFHKDIKKINKLEDRLLHLNDSYDKLIKEINEDRLYEEFLISVYKGQIGYSANYFLRNFNFKIPSNEFNTIKKIMNKNLMIKQETE
jgi:hypothetical protein